MSRNKETNARVTRWFLSLQPFAFSVVHRAGAAHGNADALSRRDALGTWTAPPPGSELRGGVCGSRRGRARGTVMEGRYVRFSALFPMPRFGVPAARQAKVAIRRRRGAAVRVGAPPTCAASTNSSARFKKRRKTSVRRSSYGETRVREGEYKRERVDYKKRCV